MYILPIAFLIGIYVFIIFIGLAVIWRKPKKKYEQMLFNIEDRYDSYGNVLIETKEGKIYQFKGKKLKHFFDGNSEFMIFKCVDYYRVVSYMHDFSGGSWNYKRIEISELYTLDDIRDKCPAEFFDMLIDCGEATEADRIINLDAN